jgi:hypothetical protein
MMSLAIGADDARCSLFENRDQQNVAVLQKRSRIEIIEFPE